MVDFEKLLNAPPPKVEATAMIKAEFRCYVRGISLDHMKQRAKVKFGKRQGEGSWSMIHPHKIEITDVSLSKPESGFVQPHPDSKPFEWSQGTAIVRYGFDMSVSGETSEECIREANDRFYNIHDKKKKDKITITLKDLILNGKPS